MIKRTNIGERTLHAKDFEGSRIKELLGETHLLSIVSKLPPFVSQIMLEFYVNLSKDMGDPFIYWFEFSPSIINQYWECEDVSDDEIEVLETDPMVSVITRGKVQTSPQKYNLCSSHLTSRYSILHKIAMRNWLPTTHLTLITKKFTTLLFQIGMKRKFNLGKLVFEHVLGHVENLAYRKAIGYPSLIFGILKAQKLDIMNPIDILGPLAVEKHINHKLYEGHHLRDVPYRKKKGQSKGKLPEILLEFGRADATKDQPSNPMTKKSDLLDRTIRSNENVLSHLYEQQLLELQLQGIQKQQEEITTVVEELKNIKARASIFSSFEEEDIEGEYTNPIPSPNMTPSPDSDSKPKT